jgi:hypothetical protein
MVPNVSEVALTRPYTGPCDLIPNHIEMQNFSIIDNDLGYVENDVDYVDNGFQTSGALPGPKETKEKEEMQLKWEQIVGSKYSVVVSFFCFLSSFLSSPIFFPSFLCKDIFFFFVGLWSQLADKLTIHSLPCSWIL